MRFCEASAKDNFNVDEIFLKLVDDILKKVKKKRKERLLCPDSTLPGTSSSSSLLFVVGNLSCRKQKPQRRSGWRPEGADPAWGLSPPQQQLLTTSSGPRSHPCSAWHTGAVAVTICCFLVAQSRPTLCDAMDCSSPGSSVHGISQARTLEWVAIPFSRGCSKSRHRTCVSCIGRRILYYWDTGEAQGDWAVCVWHSLLSCLSFLTRTLLGVDSEGLASRWGSSCLVRPFVAPDQEDDLIGQEHIVKHLWAYIQRFLRSLSVFILLLHIIASVQRNSEASNTMAVYIAATSSFSNGMPPENTEPFFRFFDT